MYTLDLNSRSHFLKMFANIVYNSRMSTRRQHLILPVTDKSVKLQCTLLSFLYHSPIPESRTHFDSAISLHYIEQFSRSKLKLSFGNCDEFYFIFSPLQANKLNLTTGTGRNLSTRTITEQTRQDVHVIETVVVLFCLFVWFFCWVSWYIFYHINVVFTLKKR